MNMNGAALRGYLQHWPNCLVAQAHVFFRGAANRTDVGGILPTLGHVDHGQPLIPPSVVYHYVQLEDLKSGEQNLVFG